MRYKVLNFLGLEVLAAAIRAVRKAADGNTSAIGRVTDDLLTLSNATQSVLNQMGEALASKQDQSRTEAVTIPVTGWARDPGEDAAAQKYPWYCDIAIPGVTARDRAEITIAPGSIQEAAACGMCPTNETLDGKIRIRAVQAPQSSIQAEYWIEAGKEE